MSCFIPLIYCFIYLFSFFTSHFLFTGSSAEARWRIEKRTCQGTFSRTYNPMIYMLLYVLYISNCVGSHETVKLWLRNEGRSLFFNNYDVTFLWCLFASNDTTFLCLYFDTNFIFIFIFIYVFQIDEWLKRSSLPRLPLPTVCGFIPLARLLTKALKLQTEPPKSNFSASSNHKKSGNGGGYDDKYNMKNDDKYSKNNYGYEK